MHARRSRSWCTRSTALGLTSALALFACKSPATAIVIEFATDIPHARPVEVGVRVGVNESAGWSTRIWQRNVPASTDPPLLEGLNSFTVHPKTDDPRNGTIAVIFDVTVHPGSVGGDRIQFRRRLHMTFTPGTTQTVRVILPLRCGEKPINCPAAEPNCTVARLCELQGQTCGDDGSCVPSESRTQPFDRADASAFDAHITASGSDGEIDSPTQDAVAQDRPEAADSVVTDVAMTADSCSRNCAGRQCGSDGCMGSCGTCTDRPNSGATCDINGSCQYSCTAGFGDCDMMAANGCETSLTSNINCGQCGMRCSGATPNCDALSRTCSSGCGGGQLRCAMSCVDAQTDVANCGACGRMCSFANGTARCAAGVCMLGTCAAGFANCDGNAGNGCEVSLGTAQNCGSCGDACSGATPICDAARRMCTSGCSAPAVRCGASCVDTTSDQNNCGACAAACVSRANSVTSCVASACRYTCNAGFADCNANAADGCETSLNSVANCGRCGGACSLAHATPACVAGSCTIGGCDSGWGNCDGNAANGCETPLTTTTNCGGCGVACTRANANATCAGGSCAIGSCVAGFGNCDGSDPNGCEVRLNTNGNCGACGAACAPANATGSCASGSCQVVSCSAGWGDCDGNGANGCETSLTSNPNCGGCGIACALPMRCIAGGCGCAGFSGCNFPRHCCEMDPASCSCTVCIDMNANCP